jgi:transcriptional regulator with XRE-family HTH domain
VEDQVDMRAMGERLLLLRRRADLSQQELARQAGVDVMTISRLERGTKKRLEVEPLARISRALGISVDDLLGLRDMVDLRATTWPTRPQAPHIPESVAEEQTLPSPAASPRAKATSSRRRTTKTKE